MSKSMSAFEWLLLSILAFLWGGSFFFTEIAIPSIPPFTIVAIRVCLAALTLFAFCIVAKLQVTFSYEILFAFVGMGILNNAIPFSLIVWGQTQIASSLASILNATTPLFTLVVAHFLTIDEKMNAKKLIGVIVGFAGVVIMISPQLIGQINGTILGQILVLGAALSYAFSGVFGRRFKKLGVNPVVTATGQLTMSSIILIPIALLIENPWQLAVPDLKVFFALGGLAILSTSLAYVIFFEILRRAGASNLLLVTFLIPVTAILLGVLVLNETLYWEQVTGMFVLATGLLVIDGRVLSYFRILPGDKNN